MTHGKVSTYNVYGCRCEACKAAKAAHAKRTREQATEAAKERQRESVRKYSQKNREQIRANRNTLDLVHIHGKGWTVGYYQAARYLHEVLGEGRSFGGVVQAVMSALYGLGRGSAYGYRLTYFPANQVWGGPEQPLAPAKCVTESEPLLLVYPLRGVAGSIVEEWECGEFPVRRYVTANRGSHA